jgi:hypothetical protein
MSEQGATKVAWNSVKNRHYQDSDRTWRIKTDDGFNQDRKGVVPSGIRE